jgi:hypothetical protein
MGQWGYGDMMGSGWGILGLLLFVFILIDAILLAVWLWKQIQKK